MQLKALISAIATVAICLLGGQAQSQPIDSIITQRMDEAGIVGLGAAIIVDKKVVWMKGYGFADRARAVPFTPDTIMNIASISKTFTGVAMMRAVSAVASRVGKSSSAGSTSMR